MGKSYKKHPVCQDNYDRKYGKRQARRKLRRTKDAVNGGEYKKHSERWSFCDYKSRITKKDAIEMFYNPSSHVRDNYSTLEEWLKSWEKYYRRK